MKTKLTPRKTICCPITKAPMRHPIYVATHHYELIALLQWFKSGNITCPLTRETVKYAIYDKDFKKELDELNPEERYDEYDHKDALEELLSCINHPYDRHTYETNKTGMMIFLTGALFAFLVKAMSTHEKEAKVDLMDMLFCIFFVAGSRLLYRTIEYNIHHFFNPPPSLPALQDSTTLPDPDETTIPQSTINS